MMQYEASEITKLRRLREYSFNHLHRIFYVLPEVAEIIQSM